MSMAAKTANKIRSAQSIVKISLVVNTNLLALSPKITVKNSRPCLTASMTDIRITKDSCRPYVWLPILWKKME